MMIHNLRYALRNFRRQAFFTFINVSGLAVGLAACWLIGLYVMHERSFDRFLPDADRICAVSLQLKMGDQEARTTNTPPPLGPRLAADFPEVELAARTFNLGAVVVRREQPGQAPLIFNESNAMAADTAFLELFGFPMIEGDAAQAIDKPGSLVLTEEMAAKYFGRTSAMGQALYVNDRLFTVTGIVKKLPSNASVQFGFLTPTADFKVIDRFSWSWIWLQMDTWLKLRQPADADYIARLESKFPAMVRAYAPETYARIGQDFDAQLKKGDRYDVELLPLRSLHLDQAGLDSRLSTLGDRRQVQVFGLVGVLTLLLACVNFMNLSTARSMKRAREVGVRKTLGSRRNALIGQFLTETLLLSIVALLFAALLAGAALPLFNRVTGLEWGASTLFAPQTLWMVAALPVIVCLAGGLYPAFYLSGFGAGDILKKASSPGRGIQARLRSGLVVFQFAVSITLMLGALVVFRQLKFAQATTPGLQREHVMVIPVSRQLGESFSLDAFRRQLLQLPAVQHASHTTYLPSMGSFGDFYEPEQGAQSHPVVANLPISSFMTDADFVPALGIELLNGRNFYGNENTNEDSTSVILNEAAVKAIGWQNPVGQWMRYPGNRNQRFQVVGVMRDFHIGSVRTPIEPVAIFHKSSKTYQTWGSYLAVRLQPGAAQQVVEKTAAIWKTMAPAVPFEYDFLDASFARLYRQEARVATVLGVFTGLALLIGCLGLFALSAFMAEQRTKEIGVRKVLGASVAGITGLLARDFLKLVLIAIALATPVAWWLAGRWLTNFAYHIQLNAWMFGAAGLAAIAIALLTISFQSVRAALTNPVNALRSE